MASLNDFCQAIALLFGPESPERQQADAWLSARLTTVDTYIDLCREALRQASQNQNSNGPIPSSTLLLQTQYYCLLQLDRGLESCTPVDRQQKIAVFAREVSLSASTGAAVDRTILTKLAVLYSKCVILDFASGGWDSAFSELVSAMTEENFTRAAEFVNRVLLEINRELSLDDPKNLNLLDMVNQNVSSDAAGNTELNGGLSDQALAEATTASINASTRKMQIAGQLKDRVKALGEFERFLKVWERVFQQSEQGLNTNSGNNVGPSPLRLSSLQVIKTFVGWIQAPLVWSESFMQMLDSNLRLALQNQWEDCYAATCEIYWNLLRRNLSGAAIGGIDANGCTNSLMHQNLNSNGNGGPGATTAASGSPNSNASSPTESLDGTSRGGNSFNNCAITNGKALKIRLIHRHGLAGPQSLFLSNSNCNSSGGKETNQNLTPLMMEKRAEVACTLGEEVFEAFIVLAKDNAKALKDACLQAQAGISMGGGAVSSTALPNNQNQNLPVLPDHLCDPFLASRHEALTCEAVSYSLLQRLLEEAVLLWQHPSYQVATSIEEFLSMFLKKLWSRLQQQQTGVTKKNKHKAQGPVFGGSSANGLPHDQILAQLAPLSFHHLPKLLNQIFASAGLVSNTGNTPSTSTNYLPVRPLLVEILKPVSLRYAKPPWFSQDEEDEDDMAHVEFIDFQSDLSNLVRLIYFLDAETVLEYLNSEVRLVKERMVPMKSRGACGFVRWKEVLRELNQAQAKGGSQPSSELEILLGLTQNPGLANWVLMENCGPSSGSFAAHLRGLKANGNGGPLAEYSPFEAYIVGVLELFLTLAKVCARDLNLKHPLSAVCFCQVLLADFCADGGGTGGPSSPTISGSASSSPSQEGHSTNAVSRNNAGNGVSSNSSKLSLFDDLSSVQIPLLLFDLITKFRTAFEGQNNFRQLKSVLEFFIRRGLNSSEKKLWRRSCGAFNQFVKKLRGAVAQSLGKDLATILAPAMVVRWENESQNSSNDSTENPNQGVKAAYTSTISEHEHLFEAMGTITASVSSEQTRDMIAVLLSGLTGQLQELNSGCSNEQELRGVLEKRNVFAGGTPGSVHLSPNALGMYLARLLACLASFCKSFRADKHSHVVGEFEQIYLVSYQLLYPSSAPGGVFSDGYLARTYPEVRSNYRILLRHLLAVLKGRFLSAAEATGLLGKLFNDAFYRSEADWKVDSKSPNFAAHDRAFSAIDLTDLVTFCQHISVTVESEAVIKFWVANGSGSNCNANTKSNLHLVFEICQRFLRSRAAQILTLSQTSAVDTRSEEKRELIRERKEIFKLLLMWLQEIGKLSLKETGENLLVQFLDSVSVELFIEQNQTSSQNQDLFLGEPCILAVCEVFGRYVGYYAGIPNAATAAGNSSGQSQNPPGKTPGPSAWPSSQVARQSLQAIAAHVLLVSKNLDFHDPTAMKILLEVSRTIAKYHYGGRDLVEQMLLPAMMNVQNGWGLDRGKCEIIIGKLAETSGYAIANSGAGARPNESICAMKETLSLVLGRNIQ